MTLNRGKVTKESKMPFEVALLETGIATKLAFVELVDL